MSKPDVEFGTGIGKFLRFLVLEDWFRKKSLFKEQAGH